jgi:hypothetical protein
VLTDGDFLPAQVRRRSQAGNGDWGAWCGHGVGLASGGGRGSSVLLGGGQLDCCKLASRCCRAYMRAWVGSRCGCNTFVML